jgi:hypothetical protein
VRSGERIFGLFRVPLSVDTLLRPKNSIIFGGFIDVVALPSHNLADDLLRVDLQGYETVCDGDGFLKEHNQHYFLDPPTSLDMSPVSDGSKDEIPEEVVSRHY